MNPQYMPPPGSFGSAPQSGARPSPAGTPSAPPGFPMPSHLNKPGTPGPVMGKTSEPAFANGPMPNMQGNNIPLQRPPMAMGVHQPPPAASPNQLANQMTNMNLGGMPRPSMGYQGGSIGKPSNMIGHQQQSMPSVNGDQRFAQPPSSHFMNGSMTPPASGRGAPPLAPGQGSSHSSGPMPTGTSGPMSGVPPSGPSGGMSSIPSGPPGPPQGLPRGPSGPMSGLPTGPPGPMSGPPGSMSAPPGPMSAPPGPMSGPPGPMSGPPGPMSGPPGPMSGPPGTMSGPPGSMSGPPGSMSGPPGSMSGPPGSMSGPPGSMSGPPGPMSGPSTGPPGPMSGPPSGPPAPMSAPQIGHPGSMSGPATGPPGHMSGSQNSQMLPQQGRGSLPPSQPHSGQPLPPSGLPGPPQQNMSFPQMHPSSLPNSQSFPGMLPPQRGNMPPMPGQAMPLSSNFSNSEYYPSGPLPPTMNSQPPPPHMPGMQPFQQQGGIPPQSTKGYSTHPDPGLSQPMSGYPSQPGMYPQGGLAGPGMQPQQARRLDPDQMPSPIQVMEDDQQNRSGFFYTNQKGLVPPLVTTNFVTQDQGNAGPRYIRSSMYSVPATFDIVKQTAVPFGLVVSPLANIQDGEYPPPIVDMGEIGPVRCIRCKAYMCPFMQFIDGGRRFYCLFCKAATEVPAEYFQHLDHTGQRVDRYDRPELSLGTYEFIATKDYCTNNVFPKPPALIFVIDVSYNNIKSGMVHLLCARIKEILQLLPKEHGAEKSVMKVGFITFNNTIHFYNIKGCLAQPQMLVVGDVQDMFMPLLEGFLCDPTESEAVIDSLMEQIPSMFADTRETETVLGPAIQAGLEALKASGCAGKLLVFNSSLPIAEAPGKLKNRDDRKLLGTEKEKTILAPQTAFYNNLGQDCVAVGCSVDLFIFNNAYIDLATVGQVARLTGGEIYKYTYFQAELDGDRLIDDIKRNVSRPVAFNAIMRIRTSTGVRATDFYGHFFMSNTTDVELASIDCDKAIAVEIKHDDKLTEEDGVYIQVALLYTSCGGQRRLRILNLSLKTCTQMADLYRSCDLDTIINFFAKQSVYRLLESTPKAVKDNLVNRCAQMLSCYRKNCANPSSPGQLILPECMKLLPLYINCVLKSDAMSGGSDMTVDDRSFVMQAVSIMDVPSSVVYFYPRLIPLHDIDVDSDEIPPPIRCSTDKIKDDGVYLLENGIYLFLWFGLNVSMEWVQNVFGVQSAAQIDIDRTSLLEIDSPLSLRIRNLIEAVRNQRHRSMRLILVRQRDKLEVVFKHFLVEDRGLDGSASYVDFLCHMHREIRNILS